MSVLPDAPLAMIGGHDWTLTTWPKGQRYKGRRVLLALSWRVAGPKFDPFAVHHPKVAWLVRHYGEPCLVKPRALMSLITDRQKGRRWVSNTVQAIVLLHARADAESLRRSKLRKHWRISLKGK